MVDVENTKYVASCSWGKDSTAMILKLIEENYPLDEVIFYDTGMEFNSIYSVRDQILPILNNNNIKYTELHPPRPFWMDMLIRQKKKRDGRIVYGDEWCGGGCRWQTFIKQRICNQYTKGHIVYIGLAKDEEKRLANLEEYKRTPLVDLNMTEKDCLQYCHDKGIFWYEDDVELYSILDRVSCWCCRNKNLKELKNIYLYLPKYWSMLKGLQSRIDAPFKGEGRSICELEERFKNELNGKEQKKE